MPDRDRDPCCDRRWGRSPGRVFGMQGLALLDVPGGAVTLRLAAADDLPELVALLAADQLGVHRETVERSPAALQPYRAAFGAISADPAHLLVVAVDDLRLIGTMQLSFIPGLAR